MPTNVPITQVWPSGISTTNGVSWIAANPSGANDPQPIDTILGVTFNSGTQSGWNGFTVFMRGNQDTPVFQNAINNQLESVLNGYSLYDNSTLPPSIQADPAPNAFNVQANLAWGFYGGKQGYQITLSNSIGSIYYQYSSILSGTILATPQLTNSTDYLFLVSLEDDVIQASLYPFNAQGFLNAPIFSTVKIKDTSVFARLPGHVGIAVNTVDTGALVYSLRPSHTMFAQFESAPLNSLTPVAGAQLYSVTTPPTPLYQPPFVPLTSSDSITPIVTPDTQRTLSGESQRINFGSSTATTQLQGVQSSVLTPYGDSVSGITDFSALNASFDIWIESSALANVSTPFMGFLVNSQGYGVPVLLPTIVPNQWNHGSMAFMIGADQNPVILVENNNTLLSSPIPVNYVMPSGLYTFVLLYRGGTATTVWIDNIDISYTSVAWCGRVSNNDPFTENTFPWVPFGTTTNSYNNGIRFDKPGSSLKVRAEALQQDSQIYGGYTLVPKYAELGRLVFDKTPAQIIPTATSSAGPGIWVTYTTLATNLIQFSCEILGQSNSIYSIEWSFGDGTYAFDQWISTQPNVQRTHQYNPISPSVGTVYATAQVTDNLGNKGYGSIIVNI